MRYFYSVIAVVVACLFIYLATDVFKEKTETIRNNNLTVSEFLLKRSVVFPKENPKGKEIRPTVIVSNRELFPSERDILWKTKFGDEVQYFLFTNRY